MMASEDLRRSLIAETMYSGYNNNVCSVPLSENPYSPPKYVSQYNSDVPVVVSREAGEYNARTEPRYVRSRHGDKYRPDVVFFAPGSTTVRIPRKRCVQTPI